MKQLFGFILPIFLLQLSNEYCASQIHLSEECYIKDRLFFTLPESSSFNVSFFTTAELPVSIQVSFVGQSKNQDNDLLQFTPDGGQMQRKRGGTSSYNELTLNNAMPLGWNRLTITFKDKQLDIGGIYTLTVLEYEITDILVAAKYLTNCMDSSPIWKVDTSSSDISIPLVGLSDFGISLVSNQAFQPGLTLNNQDVHLSYDDELVIRKPSLSLPQGKYQLLVQKIGNMLSIYTTTAKENNWLIMKAYIKEDLMELKVRTIEGEFYIILHPFQEAISEVEKTTIEPEQEIEENYKVTSKHHSEKEDYLNAKESIVKCSTQSSCTVWQIIAASTSGILLIIFLIVLLYIKWPWKNQNRIEFWPFWKRISIHTKNEDPENMNLLEPNADNQRIKDNVKFEVKSSCTEPNGQVNTQMSGSHKEVCKMILYSDKKFDYIKRLGDMVSDLPNKVILVIGQTGSGKSSFINAIINYLYRITYDDTFRFKLIDDMDNSKTSGRNSSDDITAYYIPFRPGMKHNCNYIFIDTPGFGDARGINEDKKWNQRFHEFLDKNPDINEVDGICFVTKSSDTRLTFVQEYIINGLFSMFGKDINKNIFAVFSYSDGTQRPNLFKKSGLDYNTAIDFNSKGIFNDIQCTSDSQEGYANYFRDKWELTMQNLDIFFKTLMKSPAVSLYLTTVVLEENKDINRIRDELLDLMEKENEATDEEKEDIQLNIEKNQSQLMAKIDEAQKLTGRLKKIPCKQNPLAINSYIDTIIRNTKEPNKISDLERLKERNTSFQKLLKEKKSNEDNNSFIKYFFGEKNEKRE